MLSASEASGASTPEYGFFASLMMTGAGGCATQRLG